MQILILSQLRLKKYLLLKTSPLGRVIYSCYNMASNSYCPTDTVYRKELGVRVRVRVIRLLKGICPEFQVIGLRGFSQKIPADLLSYDQIHS